MSTSLVTGPFKQLLPLVIANDSRSSRTRVRDLLVNRRLDSRHPERSEGSAVQPSSNRCPLASLRRVIPPLVIPNAVRDLLFNRTLTAGRWPLSAAVPGPQLASARLALFYPRHPRVISLLVIPNDSRHPERSEGSAVQPSSNRCPLASLRRWSLAFSWPRRDPRYPTPRHPKRLTSSRTRVRDLLSNRPLTTVRWPLSAVPCPAPSLAFSWPRRDARYPNSRHPERLTSSRTQ